MEITPLVLFEDNHLIIINKPAGMLVQADETGDIPLSELVKKYIKDKYQKPGNVFTGVVHRLDRPVSGIVVFAKTSKALSRMNELFRNNTIHKTYLAVTIRKPKVNESRLVHWLLKDESRNITKAYTAPAPNALRSELSFRLHSQQENFYLLQVNPVTGRSHQIRVQLASQNSPIAGDVKYGAPALLPDKSICLHAYNLDFTHPIRQEKIMIQALPPAVFPWTLFKNRLPSPL